MNLFCKMMSFRLKYPVFNFYYINVANIKDSLSYHLSSTAKGQDITLPTATAIAVGFHVLLIFGIGFTAGNIPSDMAMDVATVLTTDTKKMKKRALLPMPVSKVAVRFCNSNA